MKHLLFIFLLTFSTQINAAVIVHIGDDTEAWFGEDVVCSQGSNVEVTSVRFGLSAANLVAQSIVEDYVWINGDESQTTWEDLVLNFETPVYQLTCYRLSDFWNTPSPTLGLPVVDQHFYPFEVWSTDYSVGPIYLDIDGQTEVWLDWNEDTTLRVTWGATEPSEFNRWLHDGTQNPMWVSPLRAFKGKKLGHYK